MAPVRRSSARLQNRSPQKNPMTPASASKLSSLLERDETPSRGVQPVLDSIAASAPAKQLSQIPRNPLTSTPPTSRIRPSVKDMHPSRHQSTAKKLDSAKRSDLGIASALAQSPSTRNEAEHRDSESPTRNPFSSPTFEFRFTRPSSDLSSEAQRMMDEVREQAAKIKSELATQRSLQKSQDEQSATPGRKVVSAKGKIGRYSDIHMEQFKKMNSIANHPSSFRADPSRISPMAKSLKRSNSKAGLDKVESNQTRSPAAKLARAMSSGSNDSPAKRQKSIVPPARPTTSYNATAASSTPTKPTLTRSASAKSLKFGRSMIPSLNRSPSTKTLKTPQALKPAQPSTEGKMLSSFANKLTNVKSILRRPQLKFSDDPAKLAAGTHVSTPDRAFKSTNNGALPNITQETPGTPAHRKEKHVNFSSSPVKLIPSSPVQSPSPIKRVQYPILPEMVDENASPTAARSLISAAGPSDFTFRADKTITFAQPAQTTPTIRRVRPSEAAEAPSPSTSTLVELPGVPHGLSNKKRKRQSSEDSGGSDKENIPAPPAAEQQSPAKRARVTPAPPPSPTKTPKGKLMTPNGKLKTPSKGRATDPKRRGMLSLSRLNALARPKQRN